VIGARSPAFSAEDSPSSGGDTERSGDLPASD
jgi:hypothetical protein